MDLDQPILETCRGNDNTLLFIHNEALRGGAIFIDQKSSSVSFLTKALFGMKDHGLGIGRENIAVDYSCAVTNWHFLEQSKQVSHLQRRFLVLHEVLVSFGIPSIDFGR